METRSQAQLSNVFVLAVHNTCLEEISDKELALNRQKRAHHKSRNGCLNCKRRRVKCDERSPSCSSCSKRAEKCDRSNHPAQRSVRQSMISLSPPSAIMSPVLDAPSETVNLFQMKLFHHFQTCTSKTFAFTQAFWNEALKISFEFEFLMHAILCLSAKHLAYLCPTDPKYTAAAATHLAHTLRLFREILSDPFTKSNIHPLMFTASLLYFEGWSNVDFVSVETSDCTDYDAKDDPLFNLASGMRQIFLSGIDHLRTRGCSRSSVLAQQTAYRPSQTVHEAIVALYRDPDVYREYFEECFEDPRLLLENHLPEPHEARSVTQDNLVTRAHSSSVCPDVDTVEDPREAYMLVVPRISLFLTLLPEGKNQSSESVLDVFPNLLPDVARNFFSFPLLLQPGFMLMLYQNDPRSMFLLYHFYRIASHILPKQECWWAAKRAPLIVDRLKRKLWG